uniref:Uncharacterized protein n=1 Tax=viral metagenome TaxID=1070528 RepID=A0A6C0CL17_9ZZZZ
MAFRPKNAHIGPKGSGIYIPFTDEPPKERLRLTIKVYHNRLISVKKHLAEKQQYFDQRYDGYKPDPERFADFEHKLPKIRKKIRQLYAQKKFDDPEISKLEHKVTKITIKLNKYYRYKRHSAEIETLKGLIEPLTKFLSGHKYHLVKRKSVKVFTRYKSGKISFTHRYITTRVDDLKSGHTSI